MSHLSFELLITLVLKDMIFKPGLNKVEVMQIVFGSMSNS